MRIFVVGTGRCGTVTFAKAAAHATNYTVGHESHAGRIADWDYPDGHIEVSAQLTIAIPSLQIRYPQARWVHLIRSDREACVRSLAWLREGGVARDFARVWFQRDCAPVIEAASALYDTLNALCRALLPNAFELQLERARDQWAACWQWMRCEGDFAASLREWNTKHNARPMEQRPHVSPLLVLGWDADTQC